MERYELPEGWEWGALGDPEVAEINPKKSAIRHLADELLVTFVPMEAISDESGTITAPIQRFLGEVRKGYTYFSEGDVIFAKITPCMENGKSAIARELTNSVGFGSTEFHVFRPGPKVTAKWLHCLLRSKQLRDEAKVAMTGAAGQQRVPRDFLAAYEIPIPPLPEQNRLVARIEAFTERIEASRKEQQEAISMASAYFNLLCQRTYRELLEACITISLRESGNIMGGGTPSKDNAAFWKGDIPWIAPKEMKRWYIGESSLTITETAINQSAAHLIPAPAVLFVVRGMILARTVPVAISTCALTVNQDMKAIVPRQKLSAEFLAYMLLGAQPKLLSMVEVAGHGTRKLESDRWGSLPIPLPDSSKQKLIVQRLETMRRKADELTAVQRAAESDLAALMPAILAKAFRGEL